MSAICDVTTKTLNLGEWTKQPKQQYFFIDIVFVRAFGFFTCIFYAVLFNSVGWVWEDRRFLQEIDNVFQDTIVLRHGDVHVCLTYAIYCIPCLGLKTLCLYFDTSKYMAKLNCKISY